MFKATKFIKQTKRKITQVHKYTAVFVFSALGARKFHDARCVPSDQCGTRGTRTDNLRIGLGILDAFVAREIDIGRFKISLRELKF